MRRLLIVLSALVVLGALLGPAGAAAEGHSSVDVVIEGAEGTEIHATVHRPAGASADEPAPVILHSHGWGGSRSASAASFTRELDAGFGVVSFDQRGFGDSGGKAHVQDPDLEGRDVIALIDYIATLDWVARDSDPDDPVLFGMGGSYGGGFQWVGALTEIADTGSTRFNGLAPEIAWFDLSRSLAPEGVVRSAWATLLYAAGAANLADHVHPAYVYGAASGQWPDGTVPGIANLDEIFRRNGPAGFVAQDVRLDVPALVRQGADDNLFNLNEGWDTYAQALTDGARTRSGFIGFNGGHALPNVAPLGFTGSGDACTDALGGWGAVRLAYFQAVIDGGGASDVIGAPVQMATAGDRCVSTADLEATTPFEVGIDVEVASGALTTTGAGAPQHVPIADGPLTVAGIPTLTAEVTTVGVEQRVFLGLSVGTSPLTAQVVQNNLMPLREPFPLLGEERSVRLPGVAVDVDEGEQLFLTVTPVSDMSFGHGSARTPGAVVLTDITVGVPLVEDGCPGRVAGASGRCVPDPRR